MVSIIQIQFIAPNIPRFFYYKKTFQSVERNLEMAIRVRRGGVMKYLPHTNIRQNYGKKMNERI